MILVVALLLVLWLTVAPLIRWRSTHYVFTTHRVLIRRGVLKHVGRDITLGRISDVAYEQTLADRIFSAGTLHIESAGENGQETLVNIPRADDVQQTLNRLIEADSTRRGGYQPGAPGYRPPTRAPDQPFSAGPDAGPTGLATQLARPALAGAAWLAAAWAGRLEPAWPVRLARPALAGAG